MARIFIAYARDYQLFATRLARSLSDAGAHVWIDLEDIPAGVKWHNAIQEGLEQCEIMLVIITPESMDSENVEAEWFYFLDEKKPVIPVLQKRAAVHYRLRPLQYIDFENQDYDTAFRQLHAQLRRHVELTPLSTPTAEIPVQKPLPERGARRIDWRWVAGALLIPLIIGIVSGLTQTWPDILDRINGGGSTPVQTQVVSNSTPETEVPTAAPTQASAPTDTPTPTETMEIAFIVQTLDVQATVEQATLNAQATAAARATEYAVGTQSMIDQTATAAQWTDTPTPDITASIDAYRTQLAQTATEQHFQNLTATATLWTATPTSTWTPSNTPTSTATPTSTPSATSTPTSTPTVTLTRLEAAIQRASTPATSNTNWTPFEQDFDGVTMVLVPAGCFDMGSEDGPPDERPVHTQCFDEPFWIDKYEVTNTQFAQFGGVAASQSNWIDANRPREQITWFEASNFCAIRGVRLPTEAEWEYTARGPDNLIYPWGDDFVADNAVYIGNSNNQTVAVGSRPSGVSWVGALDMSGNVWEWVSSLYMDYPYRNDHEDAQNRIDVRVLRGGSSFNFTLFLRAADRNGVDADVRNYNIGVRCAHSL